MSEISKELRECVQDYLRAEAAALAARRDAIDSEDMGAGLETRVDLDSQIDSLTRASNVLGRLSLNDEVQEMLGEAQSSQLTPERLEELKEVLPKPHVDYVPD